MIQVRYTVLGPEDAQVSSTESAIPELREKQGKNQCKQRL